LGHDRWILENSGWNDLTQHWAFEHGFLHACRHRPQATTENGEPQPVAHRGLAAVSLILLLAFTLCSAFIDCRSKLVRRYGLTAIEVASQLRRSLSKLSPNIRAPDYPYYKPRTCLAARPIWSSAPSSLRDHRRTCGMLFRPLQCPKLLFESPLTA
jgi:hypothetical protein